MRYGVALLALVLLACIPKREQSSMPTTASASEIARIRADYLDWRYPEPDAKSAPVGQKTWVQRGIALKKGPKGLKVDAQKRQEYLRQAGVWMEPKQLEKLSGVGLLGSYPRNKPLECYFYAKFSMGHTTKFRCILKDGTQIKVKYSPAKAETFSHHDREHLAEPIATAILRGTGFAADDVSFVDQITCIGCPNENPGELLNE